MKMILLLVFLALAVLHVAWHGRLQRVLSWLGARPFGHFPVWKQVRSRLDELSRRERLPAPSLWILPEFSPNALMLRSFGGTHIGLTEGLLRTLNAEELDAVLVLCLAHVSGPRRFLQTMLSLQLFPFARLLQGYPMVFQVLLAPSLTFLLRAVSPPSVVFDADSKVSRKEESLAVAAALQKMAVLGRKIPLKQWNFAIDPLFLMSPLTLDGAPFWVFLSQPTVERRRKRFVGVVEEISNPCERAPSLP